MELAIKKYKYEKVETESKIFTLPTEPLYFFERGIRRSIKITPVYTTWNKEQFNKEEEIYKLDFLCLYGSFECKIEKFSIAVSEIEDIYYYENTPLHSLIHSYIDGDFDTRTKKDFESDLNSLLLQIQS